MNYHSSSLVSNTNLLTKIIACTTCIPHIHLVWEPEAHRPIPFLAKFVSYDFIGSVSQFN